jgi:pilus assembly protein FimV
VKERKVRNLTKTFAAVSLMTPMGAYALGVGDIKLHSALNQNLNAEIALVLSDTEKLTDIKVKLAPPSKFEEAGVPWSHFLSQIKFKTVTKANGAVIVKLSSTEVLNEPFLDFLLEVSWPKGDIYREFTVLVDPPAIYQQKTVPVTIKQPEPIKQQQLPTQKVFQQQPIDATAMTRSSTSEYGPTGSRDTLWKVAEKVIRNKDISVEQMMMALYEANPEAFFKPNVNALAAGVSLKVPEDDVVMNLCHREAKNEFNIQVEAWGGQVR